MDELRVFDTLRSPQQFHFKHKNIIDLLSVYFHLKKKYLLPSLPFYFMTSCTSSFCNEVHVFIYRIVGRNQTEKG